MTLRIRLFVLATLASAALGCSSITDFGRFEGPDAGGEAGMDAGDAGTMDGDAGDAAVDAPMPDGGDACVPATESCNGMDDDCDGRIDEEFDLSSDVDNCGSCGTECTTVDHGSRECVSGSCAIETCDSGWDDCDDTYDTGCETDLTADTDCGSCGNSCSGATPVCGTDDAGDRVCVDGCSDGEALCDGSCVDTDTSIMHCGECGNTCTLEHGTPTCNSGSCAIASCDAGWADCDATYSSGCETDLQTSLAHCGECSNTCTLEHGTPECIGGSCEVGSCDDAGWGYCPDSSTDTCTDLETRYSDGDGDGYGTDPGEEVCPRTTGYADVNGDCNDSDSSIRPGASETCDGVNQDCDDYIDEDALSPAASSLVASEGGSGVRIAWGGDADGAMESGDELAAVWSLSGANALNFQRADVDGQGIGLPQNIDADRAPYYADVAWTGSQWLVVYTRTTINRGAFYTYVQTDGTMAPSQPLQDSSSTTPVAIRIDRAPGSSIMGVVWRDSEGSDIADANDVYAATMDDRGIKAGPTEIDASDLSVGRIPDVVGLPGPAFGLAWAAEGSSVARISYARMDDTAMREGGVTHLQTDGSQEFNVGLSWDGAASRVAMTFIKSTAGGDSPRWLTLAPDGTSESPHGSVDSRVSRGLAPASGRDGRTGILYNPDGSAPEMERHDTATGTSIDRTSLSAGQFGDFIGIPSGINYYAVGYATTSAVRILPLRCP